ncbi:hypothetical protein CLAFUW4_03832 [Fulvia fulva]|uniref:Uncharacterized protein n=1 Tax=Passalora fulva TaxID=5499 RepID=A0A9Q8LBX0_PASFU|nr:uncharacterized protein CLAFUR5_03804 [Fulvia fulva]KAK4631719.1 hypothetical protein CLAFUR4_03820 [Fulvia fulva]KAK4633374.1 hypothetical protein CLAFUR0_03819 [Fulvia fulva]UJO14546.1 hypothetical protein CLAFUR5_03804 [Fulvia fulva]WPV11423.1 hypothetical protein CLAFUW4_03832 [Fulvia fulva]WPV26046.1 hypothetical protein CLAFUW7_03824 [Fulvia fulva]
MLLAGLLIAIIHGALFAILEWGTYTKPGMPVHHEVQDVEVTNGDAGKKDAIEKMEERCYEGKKEAAMLEQKLDRVKERLRQVEAMAEGRIEGVAESV